MPRLNWGLHDAMFYGFMVLTVWIWLPLVVVGYAYGALYAAVRWLVWSGR